MELPNQFFENPIIIRRSRDPYGWLGNMAPYPVSYQGIRYLTTEALFQSLRFSELEKEIPLRIQNESSPMKAKMISKENSDRWVVTPQSEGDLDNMRLCLRLKLGQNPELQAKLVDTGSRGIVEDCTRRQGGSGLFWGAAEQADGSWTGLNWLGKLWSLERDRVKTLFLI